MAIADGLREKALKIIAGSTTTFSDFRKEECQ
jgi:hypothetical protein